MGFVGKGVWEGWLWGLLEALGGFVGGCRCGCKACGGEVCGGMGLVQGLGGVGFVG